MILNALTGKPLPVYGDGLQVRDWLYVEDHCAAVHAVLTCGRPGETYNIGGRTERKNIEIVGLICSELDRLRPKPGGGTYRDQIVHVKDRAATTAATPSTPTRSRPSWVGRRASRSRPVSARRSSGSRPIRLGSTG